MNHDGTPDDVEARDLYIDLMKRVVDQIYADDPLGKYVFYHRGRKRGPAVKNWAVAALEKFLWKRKIRLVTPYSFPGVDDFSALSASEIDSLNDVGAYWPARAHSMIGRRRLENLRHCAETVLQENVPGDMIETGVWRGGACIFMRAILKGIRRPQAQQHGLPTHSPAFRRPIRIPIKTMPAISSTPSPISGHLTQSRGEEFRVLDGLLDNQVQFLEGWFKDTLHKAPIEQLAVLRLDGDMYESTIQALDALYGRLSVGGIRHRRRLFPETLRKGCARLPGPLRHH